MKKILLLAQSSKPPIDEIFRYYYNPDVQIKKFALRACREIKNLKNLNEDQWSILWSSLKDEELAASALHPFIQLSKNRQLSELDYDLIYSIVSNLLRNTSDVELQQNIIELLSTNVRLQDLNIIKLLLDKSRASVKIRRLTVQLLDRYPNSKDLLFEAIDDEEIVRIEAIRALGKYLDTDSVKIFDKLMSEGLPTLRQTILDTVVNNVNPNVLILLIKGLKDVILRVKAVEGLVKLGSEEALDPLLKEYQEIQKKEKKPSLFYIELVRAISSFSSPKIVKILSEIFDSEYSPCYIYSIEGLLKNRNHLNTNISESLIGFLEIKGTEFPQHLNDFLDLLVEIDNPLLIPRIIDLIPKFEKSGQQQAIIFAVSKFSSNEKSKYLESIEEKYLDLLKPNAQKTLEKKKFETKRRSSKYTVSLSDFFS